MAGPSDAMAPHGVRDQDLRALIGLLAVIEGHMMTHEVPQRLAEKLHDRFVLAGLLNQTSSPHDLRQAISDLNQRLRYARGEYHEPPADDTL